MPILAIVFPVAAAVVVAQSLIGSVANWMPTMLALGVVATLFLLFRPLLTGILRAAVLLIAPRKSLEQRVVQHRFKGVNILNRMANDYSSTQPNFAAELRSFAARDSR